METEESDQKETSCSAEPLQYGYDRYEKAEQKTDKKAEKKAVKKAKTKKAGGGRLGVAIACGLLFGVFAASAFQVTNYFGSRLESRLNTTSTVSAVTQTPALSGNTGTVKEVNRVNEGLIKTATEYNGETLNVIYDVTEVVENVMPSIVSITNKGVQEVRMMYGGSMQYESESAGSGIILGENDTELLIMTNNHVVEGAKELSVAFIDEEVYAATVKGTAPDDDLAVIAVKKEDIKDSTMEKIAIADIGNSETLKLGQPVVAIGNALGYGQSVTAGIVSALNRDVTIDNTEYNLIQTDAAINPGNSGGALLNLQGQVVGINSAKFASAQVEGMGFAIPISDAMPILEQLMNRATRDKIDEDERGYLGIANNIDLPKDYADALGIPTGVYITEVIKDSPAEKAGLLKGDVLKKFDGIAVSDMTSLKEQMQYYKAGEKVELLILRSDDGEYKEKTVEVTLGTKDVLGDDADTSDQNSDSKDSKDKDKKEIEDYVEEKDKDQDNQQNKQYEFSFDPFSFFGF
ncbi:MAG: trypsin-like peptidase domain-containing protein [Lachnospiraceae bacterium]|nr:trypsin-like peptidase domain-containing protein [Lachnospiraceae bacterium]